MLVQMGAKIDEKDLKFIQNVASARGQGAGDFLRLTLHKELARLGFLNKDDAKALEV